MRRKGFTLIEVLMAMAIVGLILVAMNSFVFSMGELWGRNSDVRLFDQHVRAVTRYLQQMLDGASRPPYAMMNATPIGIQSITPSNGEQANLVTFELTAGNRIFVWPDKPLPEVVCSLQQRPNEGLILLWHSRLENNFTTDPPREIVITPLVTGMTYDYFDTDFNRWDNETILKTDTNGNPEIPNRLHLIFTYGKMHRDVVLWIYPTPQGMPNP